MVVLKIDGGLGNQLFLYNIYWILSHRYDVYFDVDAYNLPANNGYRRFELYSFNTLALKMCIVADSFKKRIKYIFRNIWNKNKIKILSPKEKSILRTYAFCYETTSASLHEISDNMYVTGFFQDSRFLSSDFLNSLSFKYDVKERLKVLATEMINNKNSVSVHVRRGDYLTTPGYNVCTREYYDRAIQYITSKVSNPIFYIFSDDISWCIKNFVGMNYIFVTDELVSYLNSTIEDLYLMSCCNHSIMANSTYSYWGGVIGCNPNRIIVMSSEWTDYGIFNYERHGIIVKI